MIDPGWKLWAVIVLVGAANYLSRLSFIELLSRRSVPPWSPPRCATSRWRC